MVQTAEGSLDEVHSMLQRVRELAVQYKNGSLSTRRPPAIQTEVNQLASEIERIGTSAEFNGIKLLNAGLDRVTFQVGANDGESSPSPPISLGATVGSTSRARRPRPRHREIDTAIDTVSHSARTFGAVQNRLEYTLAERGDLPGEPDRLREPHPRRGHGRRDGRLHQAPDPAAGRHVDAGAGQPGPAERPVAAPLAAPAEGAPEQRATYTLRG